VTGSPGQVLYEVRGTTGWVVFDRPEARNAMTFAMYEQFQKAMAAVEDDRSLRAVVLTGAGPSFVAGTDIAEFRTIVTEEDALAYEAKIDTILDRLEGLRVPTVAALRGACAGAGVGIAASCDIRLGSPSAAFGLPIARTLGNCLSMGNYARLSQLIGAGQLKEIVFSSRMVPAPEARQMGFLQEVVADEDSLLPRAEELAGELATRAPLTLWATKEALRRLRQPDRLPDGSDLIVGCYLSEDFREGREAFLAKRPAKWTGK
jgi:enoyl-CoA hydratase/carnithine racemase